MTDQERAPHSDTRSVGDAERGEALRRGLAVAGLVFALAAPVAYMVARAVEREEHGFVDAGLRGSMGAHPAYYARAWIAATVGVVVAAVVGMLTLRGLVPPERAAWVVRWASVPIAVAVVVAAWLLP